MFGTSVNRVSPEVEICSKLLIIWSLNQNDDKIMFDPEYEKVSFIAKVLRKKMEAFGIDVKLPDPLIMIIETCTQSNPGVSQLLLKKVLAQRSNVDSDNVVTPTMFALAFGESFPVMSDHTWEKRLHDEWDAQKAEDGSNKCDTPEWWRDFS